MTLDVPGRFASTRTTLVVELRLSWLQMQVTLQFLCV